MLASSLTSGLSAAIAAAGACMSPAVVCVGSGLQSTCCDRRSFHPRTLMPAGIHRKSNTDHVNMSIYPYMCHAVCVSQLRPAALHAAPYRCLRASARQCAGGLSRRALHEVPVSSYSRGKCQAFALAAEGPVPVARRRSDLRRPEDLRRDLRNGPVHMHVHASTCMWPCTCTWPEHAHREGVHISCAHVPH